MQTKRNSCDKSARRTGRRPPANTRAFRPERLTQVDGIGKLLGEEVMDGEFEVRLHCCDPCQSQQKAGCEKNHTEIRQLLEKGTFAFDDCHAWI